MTAHEGPPTPDAGAESPGAVLPSGWLRSTVTWLEMTAPPWAPGAPPPLLPPSPELRVDRGDGMGVADYRALYRAVGEAWMWWERLGLSDDALAGAIAAPGAEIRLLRDGNGAVLGYSEIARRTPGEAEIAYFGLVPAAIGRGLGRFLMTATLLAAWGDGDSAKPGATRRVWLHTCTEDHPAALAFYRRSGFRPWRSTTQVIPDPRRTGLIPATASPHIPLIAPPGAAAGASGSMLTDESDP